MQRYFYLLLVLGLMTLTILDCQGKQEKHPKSPESEATGRELRYKAAQLEEFLDSIGKLPSSNWAAQAAHLTDSIFRGQQRLKVKIADEDFSQLKKAIKAGSIAEGLVQKYGWVYNKEMVEKGKLPVIAFSFNEKREEFALCFGNPDLDWECELYFFKSNQCIARHHIYHRYGLELAHFQDADGKTVVYYKENFESGTGVWWFDFYFYKYSGEALIPVLNVLQNGNISIMPAYSSRWLESTVLKTSPLTIKMTYYFNLGDKTLEEQQIINDSTIVTYAWDEKTQAFEGNYNDAKLSENQILSYNLASDPLFFLHSNYRVLKTCLQRKDQAKREAVLLYLDDLKAGLSD